MELPPLKLTIGEASLAADVLTARAEELRKDAQGRMHNGYLSRIAEAERCESAATRINAWVNEAQAIVNENASHGPRSYLRARRQRAGL